MKVPSFGIALVLLILLNSSFFFAQAPEQPDFVKQGQQLIREGKPQQALDLYEKTLQASPDSVPAMIATGGVLDYLGKGDEARKYFAKAIEVASTSDYKVRAQRAMAISYAFEGNCSKAGEYEQQIFDYFGTAKDFYQQGEMANEAGRICIDAGDLDGAEKWYSRGHNAGLAEPNITPARQDLWNFRWAHAEARIAARKGQQSEAQKNVTLAKSILDKARIPEQLQFLPYLEGYVAFYAGDYKNAMEQFSKANQEDAFIQCMIGQTYEKLGEKDKATEYYRKASLAPAHNPPAAYAVPFTRKKLSSVT